MRVSLVNLNLIAQDAIGGIILNQVRFFQRLGDDVRVYLMHPPQGVPETTATLTRVTTLADLIGGQETHFSSSDLIVYHYPRHYALIESMKGLERGAVIFYYHNVTPPELWGSRFEQETLQRSREAAGTFALCADLAVTDSPYSAEELVQTYGCAPERVRALPLGVALEQFKPGSRSVELLQRYALEGQRVILFVGRMAGNKRIDLLVEALPIIRQRVPNAVLMLVGDDQGNPALQETTARARARAEELGVAHAVRFTGQVDDLPAHYRLADVYASASLHEGFGVPLVEAMASGVPVVASRIATHPWLVGKAGLLAEPGDAADLADQIVRVLTDDELCGELVRQGLTRAREFSVEHYEAGWASVVAEATAWLPGHTELQLASLSVQPAAEETNRPMARPQSPANAVVEQLMGEADVMMRGYRVRSGFPVIGPVIAWMRRNLTSHLREPYVDPTFERQVTFNRHTALALRQLIEPIDQHIEAADSTLKEATAMQQDLEERMIRVEGWLNLISAQLSFMSAQGLPQIPDAGISEVRKQIEMVRTRLETCDRETSEDEGEAQPET